MARGRAEYALPGTTSEKLMDKFYGLATRGYGKAEIRFRLACVALETALDPTTNRSTQHGEPERYLPKTEERGNATQSVRDASAEQPPMTEVELADEHLKAFPVDDQRFNGKPLTNGLARPAKGDFRFFGLRRDPGTNRYVFDYAEDDKYGGECIRGPIEAAAMKELEVLDDQSRMADLLFCLTDDEGRYVLGYNFLSPAVPGETRTTNNTILLEPELPTEPLKAEEIGEKFWMDLAAHPTLMETIAWSLLWAKFLWKKIRRGAKVV